MIRDKESCAHCTLLYFAVYLHSKTPTATLTQPPREDPRRLAQHAYILRGCRRVGRRRESLRGCHCRCRGMRHRHQHPREDPREKIACQM